LPDGSTGFNNNTWRSLNSPATVLPWDVRPVDLDELVLAEAGRLRAAGATVTVAGPDAVRIDGSRSELTRLLRNLGDNAVAHARSTVTLGLTVQDQQAVLSVADDGPGVPTADRERIFQRFTRLDAARTRTADGGGAGLGLAICRQIVQRHHGQITVGGGVGDGGRFVVRLPMVTGHSAPSAGAAS